MELINYKDFDTTVFENDSELICLNIDGIKMWTTPKNYRYRQELCKAWENSEEYKELEYKRWFGTT